MLALKILIYAGFGLRSAAIKRGQRLLAEYAERER